MPHKSIRRTLGITPSDLWREYWHPDRDNLLRVKCKIISREQKLLICELIDDSPTSSSRTASTSSSKSPRRWLPFSTIRRLFKSSARRPSGQATSEEDNVQSNGTQRYKVVGKIYPADKSTGVFKNVPSGLMAIEPPSLCRSELIRDVRNYLRQSPHRQDWTIRGALPKSGQAPAITSNADAAQTFQPRKPTTANDSLPQTSHPLDASDQRRYVLLERRVRCNCEESFHPRHRLQITYKPGYTPDPQKTAEAERKAKLDARRRQRADATTAACAAVTVSCCAAAAVVCAGGG